MKRNPAGGAEAPQPVHGITMTGRVRHIMPGWGRDLKPKCGADAEPIRTSWHPHHLPPWPADFLAEIATWPVCKRCKP